MVKQQFTGKKVACASGPIAAKGVPGADSKVRPRHVMASRGISSGRKK